MCVEPNLCTSTVGSVDPVDIQTRDAILRAAYTMTESMEPVGKARGRRPFKGCLQIPSSWASVLLFLGPAFC